MSGAQLFAMACLVTLLAAMASYQLGFALGEALSRVRSLPHRVRRLLAGRWYFTRLACAGRWHHMLSQFQRWLARHVPQATGLRHYLAERQQRYRGWLLAELSHLHQEDGIHGQ